jgi:hypothetical protein
LRGRLALGVPPLPTLHAATEEEGEAIAEEIRESLEFLFEGLHSHIDRGKKFSASMKKLASDG